MIQFVVRRILRLSIVLLGALLIVFLLMHAIPGSPWDNYSTSPRLIVNWPSDIPLRNEMARRFGLNQPLWRQYIRYVVGDFDEDGTFFCGAVCGNLGPSIIRRGRTVQSILFDPPLGKPIYRSQFGYSAQLILLASLIAVGLGIPLGVLSALKPRSLAGRAISFGMALLTAIPNFVLGLVMIIVAALWLKLINVVPDWNNPAYWLLPAFILCCMPMASIARVTHAIFTSLMKEDFIRTAHAKGLTHLRVVLVHVLRNALAPITTFTGPALMDLFTGLIIVENMFGFPGIGREYWESVLELDYPMIMGVTVIYATMMVLVNFLMEVLSSYLDPRIRISKTQGIS